MRHPVLGPIEFEYSVFAVEDAGGPISMVTYNPIPALANFERIQRLIENNDSPASPASRLRLT